MNEILSAEEFDDILIAMRRHSSKQVGGATPDVRAEHRDKALERHKAAFAAYRAALARIAEPPVPKCPWPVDVWPMKAMWETLKEDDDERA